MQDTRYCLMIVSGLISRRGRKPAPGPWLLVLLTGLFGLLGADPASGQASARPAQSITVEFVDSQDSDRDIQMVTLGLGLGKELVRTLYGHVGAKLALTTGTRFDEDDPGVPEREADGLGAGLLGLLRWSPLRLSAVEPYVEVSLGMVFTLEEFPPGGTVWNFWSRWGVGVSIPDGEKCRVRSRSAKYQWDGLTSGVANRHLHGTSGVAHRHLTGRAAIRFPTPRGVT